MVYWYQPHGKSPIYHKLMEFVFSVENQALKVVVSDHENEHLYAARENSVVSFVLVSCCKNTFLRNVSFVRDLLMRRVMGGIHIFLFKFTHASIYSSGVQCFIFSWNQLLPTLTLIFPSPTGAIFFQNCSAFFDGGTYFGHNSAKALGGEEVFGNT